MNNKRGIKKQWHKIRRKPQISGGVRTYLTVSLKTDGRTPYSLLAAESEDTVHIKGLLAKVPAVKTNPHRPVAQLTQYQCHSTEVQDAAAEIIFTHRIDEIIELLCV